MTGAPWDRRAFVGSVGALTAAHVLGSRGATFGAADLVTERLPVPRGLAPDAGDFLLDPGLTYLQTGSLGPTPRPVMDQVMTFWRELERNPTLWGYGPHELAMEGVREKAARFIGCSKDELILTGCTTDGMNRVAQGLHLAAGDRVLLTDQEHPGGRSGWKYLERTQGVALDFVPIPPGTYDPATIVAAFASRITPRTKVMMCSHLLTSTGVRMPVSELSKLGREHDCTVVVDGAQAAGGIVVDVKALGCHAYVTSGHKWMLGPKGTGLLYLSAELGARIDPITSEGGRNAYSSSQGVSNLPSVLGLGASIDYLNAIGPTAIEQFDMGLAARVHEGLLRLPRIRVVSAPPGPHSSPLVTYELPPAMKAADFQKRLYETHGVFLKVVPAEFLNGNRVSTHLFNTEADVDRLLVALRTELA